MPWRSHHQDNRRHHHQDHRKYHANISHRYFVSLKHYIALLKLILRSPITFRNHPAGSNSCLPPPKMDPKQIHKQQFP